MREVPRSTEKSQEVPKSTKKYEKYQEVQSDLNKWENMFRDFLNSFFKEKLPGTKKLEKIIIVFSAVSHIP